MNKEKYIQLCEAEGSRIPLFQQYWWMETVCEGKQWDVLLSQRDGRIEGALPYLLGRKCGLKYILQPQLTQFCGPWYNCPENVDRLEFEHRVGGDLAAQLNALGARICLMHFSPTVTDWLPFRWAGYQQTTRYTYRFPSIADPDSLFQHASRVRRRHMEEVESLCRIEKNIDLKEFIAFHKAYYERRGERDLIPERLIENVCTTAIGRGQGLLWGLRSDDGALQATWFVAFDDRCGYSLLLAIGEKAPTNAMTYLMWQVLKHLSTLTQAFDFEGSIEPGLELFYRTFGTTQTPFFEVSRFRPRMLQLILDR